MSKIEDLIAELYPTTSSTTGASPASATAAARPTAVHSFDDDSVSADPVPTNVAVAKATPTAVLQPPAKPAVPWPSLPPTIGPSPLCPAGTYSLTSYASATAMAEQKRLMHLQPSQLGSAVACRPSKPGADDDGGRWCPYIRCRHCDHPVVRLQGAYWTEAGIAAASAAATDGGNRDSAATPPAEANQGATPSSAAKHSFDDSSDDDHAGAGNAGPSATNGGSAAANAMYMLMRYHYPDFSAFPRHALVRQNGAGDDDGSATPAAAYSCQCTWVSVFEPRLVLPCAGHGAPPATVPPQPSAVGVQPPPSSSRGVQWACKGHCL